MPEIQPQTIEKDYHNFKSKSEMRLAAQAIYDSIGNNELKMLFGLKAEREQDELLRQQGINSILQSSLPGIENLTKDERSFFVRSLTSRYLVNNHTERYRRSPLGNKSNPRLASPFVNSDRYYYEMEQINIEEDARKLYQELRSDRGSTKKSERRIKRRINQLIGTAAIFTVVSGTAFWDDVKKISKSIENVFSNRQAIAITLGQDAEVPESNTVPSVVWDDLSSSFTVSVPTSIVISSPEPEAIIPSVTTQEEDSDEADPTAGDGDSGDEYMVSIEPQIPSDTSTPTQEGSMMAPTPTEVSTEATILIGEDAPTITITSDPTTATIAAIPTEESISGTPVSQSVIVEDQSESARDDGPHYEVEDTADNLHELLTYTLLNSAIGYKEYVERSQDLTDDQKEKLLAEIDILIEKYTNFKENFVINLVITDRDGSGGERAYYSVGNEHVGASDGIFQIQFTPEGEIFVFALGRDNPVRWIINRGGGEFKLGDMTTAEYLNSLVPGEVNTDGSLATALDNGGMPVAFDAIFGNSGDLNIRFNLAVLNDISNSLFPDGVDLTFSEGFANTYLSYEAGETHHLSGRDLQELLRQRKGIEGGSTNRGVGVLKKILSNPSNILSLIASMDTDFWDVIWDQNLNDNDRSLTVGSSQDRLVFYLLAAMFKSNDNLGQAVLGLAGRSLRDGNFGPSNIIALQPENDGDYSDQVDEVLSQ